MGGRWSIPILRVLVAIVKLGWRYSSLKLGCDVGKREESYVAMKVLLWNRVNDNPMRPSGIGCWSSWRVHGCLYLLADNAKSRARPAVCSVVLLPRDPYYANYRYNTAHCKHHLRMV